MIFGPHFPAIGAIEKYWNIIPKANAKAKSYVILVLDTINEMEVKCLTNKIIDPKTAQGTFNGSTCGVHDPFANDVAKDTSGSTMADPYSHSRKHGLLPPW